jgi:predicted nucleic acid-binding protein
MILLDTNVLGRITNSADPQCAAARRAIRELPAKGQPLVIFPQSLYEFWAIATRMPVTNGLGMTASQAYQWIAFFRQRFPLLPDPNDLPDRWIGLVNRLGIKGFRAHDARLAAAMQCHGIYHLLTFNGGDFKHLPVTVLDPETV